MKVALSKTAAVAAALLISSCVTKTTERGNAENSGSLAASFVDQPAHAEKKPLFTGAVLFFSRLLPRKTPPTPTASPVHWAGEIRMVNIAENFVLVESNSAAATVTGGKYLAVKNGRETGAVRMTSLRNPPFLIADIVSGDPSPGDKIHLQQPTMPHPPMENNAALKPGFFQKSLREILPTPKPKH